MEEIGCTGATVGETGAERLLILCPEWAEREEEMSSSSMILKDGTEMPMQGGAALNDMKAHYENRAAMTTAWEKLTPENLSVVQIKTDGTVTGNYKELVLESETSTVATDGSVDTVWKIREKTDMERMMERLAAIESGQGVQDGAIDDLGTVTSELYGEVEALKGAQA